MRHVSWRYGELGSSAMSRQPVGSWGFPGPCSTAGKIDMSATVEMGFTHDVKRRAGGVPTACRSRTSRRFWRWHCPHPTCGPRFYALQLARQHRFLSASTVYRALRRMDLGTRQQRLVVLERHSAQRAGLLTERTRRELQRARRQRRHVEANEPGELVCLDTFYIGRLKGVGESLADHGLRCSLLVRGCTHHPGQHR